MPRSRPSTDSTRHKGSPSPPLPRSRLQQANLDTTLAGEGAWSQACPHENGLARNHDGTAFPPQMREVAGEIDNEELFDKTLMSTDFGIHPTSIHHLGAQGNPDHFNTAQGAEFLNGTLAHNLQYRNLSLPSQELGAHQLTPSVNCSLYQTDLGLSHHVHLWLATTPGNCNVPSVTQENDGIVVHHSSTRDRSNASTGWPTRGCDAASTRWKSRSSISYDDNRDTMGAEGGFELMPGFPIREMN